MDILDLQIANVKQKISTASKIFQMTTDQLRKFNRANKQKYGKNLTRTEIFRVVVNTNLSKLRDLTNQKIKLQFQRPPVQLPQLTDDDVRNIYAALGLFDYTIVPQNYEYVRDVKDDDYPLDSSDDEIKIQMRELLPKKFPYYAQGYATVFGKGGTVEIHERRAVRIENNNQLENYIETTPSRIRTYDFDKVETLRVTIIDANFKKQKVISVAKYQIGNCLLNLLQNVNISKVYNAFPHLQPLDNKPVYISHDEIDKVCKMSGVSITAYSKLGVKTNTPWAEFGYKKSRRVHVEFSEGHATIVPGKFKVDKILYKEDMSIEAAYQPDVIDRKMTDEQFPSPLYYVRMLNQEQYMRVLGRLGYDEHIHDTDTVQIVMFKSFRPSTITSNRADDIDIHYAYCSTPEQFLTKLFKKKYNLQPTDHSVKDIVKSAEHFVGREYFETTNLRLLESDANKHYCSYKFSKYYVGFPVKMVPVEFSGDIEHYSFIYLANIIDPPKSFQRLAKYTSGPFTATQAEYKWLVERCVVEPLFAIYSNFQDIDICEFTNSLPIDPASVKKFRNSLIGRLIAGGIAETKSFKVDACDTEREQLLYECEQLGLSFQDVPYLTPIDDQGRNITHRITIDYKNKTNAIFHFHAFILGYALTSMLDRWEFIESKGATVVGFNVDSITYTYHEDLLESSLEMGKWKVTNAKPIKHVSSPVTYPERPPLPTPTLIETPRYATQNILILGAGGIGKSYDIKKNPYVKQLITTPTRDLRDDHKRMFDNVTTHEKQYHISKSRKLWEIMRAKNQVQSPDHVVIDEVFMMCAKDMEETYQRATSQGSMIIAIGDDKQICSEIAGPKLTRKWFEQHNFQIIEQQRDISKPSRHSFEYGTYLDSYRDLSIKKQMKKALEGRFNVTDEHVYSVSPDLEYTQRVIAGDWKTCKKYNDEARISARSNIHGIWCKLVQTDGGSPVKNPTYHLLDPDHPKIFWDKVGMTTEIPIGLRYIPAYATTIDSFQGKTAQCKLLLHMKSLDRYGCFYTAITRTQTSKNITILY